jgi:hypothetical protein
LLSVIKVILIVAAVILTAANRTYAAHSGAECYLHGHRIYLQSPLQLLLIPLLTLALLFDKLFPNQPTPAEDNSNRQERLVDAATPWRTLWS